MRLETIAFLGAVATNVAVAYHWREYPWVALASLLTAVLYCAVHIRAQGRS